MTDNTNNGKGIFEIFFSPKCLVEHSNHNLAILIKENNQGKVCNLTNT